MAQHSLPARRVLCLMPQGKGPKQKGFEKERKWERRGKCHPIAAQESLRLGVSGA